jgi:hypothetical protein
MNSKGDPGDHQLLQEFPISTPNFPALPQIRWAEKSRVSHLAEPTDFTTEV